MKWFCPVFLWSFPERPPLTCELSWSGVAPFFCEELSPRDPRQHTNYHEVVLPSFSVQIFHPETPASTWTKWCCPVFLWRSFTQRPPPTHELSWSGVAPFFCEDLSPRDPHQHMNYHEVVLPCFSVKIFPSETPASTWTIMKWCCPVFLWWFFLQRLPLKHKLSWSGFALFFCDDLSLRDPHQHVTHDEVVLPFFLWWSFPQRPPPAHELSWSGVAPFFCEDLSPRDPHQHMNHDEVVLPCFSTDTFSPETPASTWTMLKCCCPVRRCLSTRLPCARTGRRSRTPQRWCSWRGSLWTTMSPGKVSRHHTWSWQGRHDRSMWQRCHDKWTWQGCHDKWTWQGCHDKWIWQGCHDKWTLQGCHDRRSWQKLCDRGTWYECHDKRTWYRCHDRRCWQKLCDRGAW